jgi:hypothetical protein
MEEKDEDLLAIRMRQSRMGSLRNEDLVPQALDEL